MTGRQLHKWVPEYPSILSRAGREGWLSDLVAAHAVPCTSAHAVVILASLGLHPRDLDLRWGNRRGRARWHPKTRRYSISLPGVPGGTWKRLRAGLVIHEAAHVIDRRKTGTFGHGEKFCRQLRAALTTDWRSLVMTSSFREIYDRHRGPYALIVTTEEVGKKGKAQGSGRHGNVFSAEEAHEEARILVNSKAPVLEVFVYSETEGQFIGAQYKRGESYRPWHEEHGRVELCEPVQENDEPRPASPALVPGREEPLHAVGDLADAGEQTEAVHVARQVRDVPAKARTSPRPERIAAGPRKPGSALRVADGRDDWPKSEAAQAVKAHVEAHPGLTAAAIVAAIGPRLNELGVAHPASLVSRLKQAGFLKESA